MGLYSKKALWDLNHYVYNGDHIDVFQDACGDGLRLIDSWEKVFLPEYLLIKRVKGESAVRSE